MYVKAVDGYQKLERDTLIAFQNESEDRKNIIHEIFTERLKDLQNLSEINYLS